VGRWGTAARLAVGFTLVILALAVWDASWLELLVGLVALPALATLVMSSRPRSASPLRLGAAGHVVTLAHVVVMMSVVPEAAALFYGSMALLAGLQGNRGCEITAVATRYAAATIRSAARSSHPSTSWMPTPARAPAALPSNDRTRRPSSGLRARV
jgi:hypothetical protein